MTPLVSFHRLLCTALLAGAALQASADVVVQDLDFGFGPLQSHQGTGSMTSSEARTRLFQQFDPALGTLTGARWELQSAWAGFGVASVESQLSNPNAPVTGIFAIQVGMDTRVNFAGGLLGTGGQYFSAGHQASAACTTTLALGACQMPLEFGGMFDGVLVATDLDALIGTAAFEQGVEAAISLLNTGASQHGGVEMSSSGQLVWADRIDRGGIGRLRLVYEFDAVGDGDGPHGVPEPSSFALAAMGLLGAACRIRRTRRASAVPLPRSCTHLIREIPAMTTFARKNLCVALLALACHVPGASAQVSTASAERLHAEALASFRAARFPEAYGRFRKLADAGHAPSARMALWMFVNATSVFDNDWDSSPEQLESWARLAGQPVARGSRFE